MLQAQIDYSSSSLRFYVVTIFRGRYSIVQLLAGVLAASVFYLLRDEEYSSDLLDGK